MAGVALALVVVFGLIRGDDFDDLFLIGISLAIAAIPTGLPGGRHDDALARDAGAGGEGRDRQAAAVGGDPRLDVGDLLRQDRDADAQPDDGARARRRRAALLRRGRGLLDRAARSCASRARATSPLEPFLLPMALANDAAVRDGEIVGDPTEAALVVLAAKGGLDVDETRRAYPRVAEVPFDSEYKFMATFHEMEEDGRKVVRCFVKGAPDVLLARSSHVRDADGSSRPGRRRGATVCSPRTTGSPARACACSPSPRATSTRPRSTPVGSLLDEVQGLTLLALVGIVDPPRKEARDAIARCKEAGIRVRMITGDHATTAAAIAGQLGIEGRALTGRRVRRAHRRGARRGSRRDRRRRARRARGQGAPRRHAQAPGQRRRDDGRRRQRRAGAEARGHRRRDGDHRHRGDEGSGRHDPHRRQLRHDRRPRSRAAAGSTTTS